VEANNSHTAIDTSGADATYRPTGRIHPNLIAEQPLAESHSRNGSKSLVRRFPSK
jgi:hypothetical protein